MYKLYGRKGGGSLAVQVVLEEIGAPYEMVWVGREEADEPAYRRIHPLGKIPALGLPDGTVIFESAAMCIHLTNCHPEAGLAPAVGTPEHGRYLQWMVFLSANLYETDLRIYYPHRYSAGGEADAPRVRAQAEADFARQLALVESQLDPFLLGATPTAADHYLHMLASWGPPSSEETFRRFPKVGRLADLLMQRPKVGKAWSEGN